MSLILHLKNARLKACHNLVFFFQLSKFKIHINKNLVNKNLVNKNLVNQVSTKFICLLLNIVFLNISIFNSTALASQSVYTQAEQDWIHLNTTIKVAVSSDYAPISFVTNNQKHAGISADYLALIEQQLQQVNPAFKFVALVPSAAQRADNDPYNKRVDMVVDFVQTPERLKYWQFTKPYISMPLHLIARVDSKLKANLNELNGKKVAVVGFYAAAELLAKQNPGLQLKLVNSNQEGLSNVAFGEADAFVSDLPVASYWANEAGLVGLRVVGSLPYVYEISFATSYNERILHGILEKSLAQIRANTRQKIQERWYKGPFVIKPFFKDARHWLMLAGLIIFALLTWCLKKKIRSQNSRLRNQQRSLALITQNQVDETQTLLDIYKHYSKISAHTLNVERVSIWMFNSTFDQLDCVCLYLKSSDSYIECAPFNLNESPIYLKALATNRVIAIQDTNQKNIDLDINKEYLQANKISASLDSTIFLNGKTIGIVCHEHVGGTRKWKIDEQSFAGSIADLSRSAIESIKRKEAETALQQYSNQLADKVIERTAALTKSEMRYRYVVENAPIPIIVLDQDGIIIEANPEAQLAAGYKPNAIINRNFIKLLVAKEHRKKAYLAVKEILDDKLFRGIELSLQNAAGAQYQYICSMGSAMQNTDGDVQMVAIAQDISKQKALQTSLENAHKAAQSADRIKSMFVASMSHELRTTLNSIIGFLGVVLQGMSGEINPKQKDQLSRAYHSARHLLSLISDVIDVSKIEADYLETYIERFELKPLLAEIEHAIMHILEGKVLTVDFNCDENIVLETDRKRLYQVVLNVVSNAVKYSIKGSVEINALVNDKWLTISVKDTGIGIAKADIAKLFKPFERIDSPLKIKTLGTGLGLYLTHKILTQLLNGSITVKSKLNVGTVFLIKVPINAILTAK